MSAYLTALNRGRIADAEAQKRAKGGVKEIINPMQGSIPAMNAYVAQTPGASPAPSFGGLNTLLRPSEYKAIEEQGKRVAQLREQSFMPAASNKNYGFGATVVNALAHSGTRSLTQLGANIQNEIRGDGDIENMSFEQRDAANAYTRFNEASKQRDSTFTELAELKNSNAIDEATYADEVAKANAEYDKFKLDAKTMKVLDTKVTKKVGGYGNNSSAMRTEDTGLTVAEATAKAIQAKAHKEKIAGSRDGSVDNIFGSGGRTNKAAMDRLNRKIDKLDRAALKESGDGTLDMGTVIGNRVKAAASNPKATASTLFESAIYMVPLLGQAAAGLDTMNMYDNAVDSSLDSVGGGLFLDAEDQKRVNQSTSFYGGLNVLSAGAAGKLVSGAAAKTFGKNAANPGGNLLTRDILAPLTKTRAGKVAAGVGITGLAAVGEGVEEFSQDIAEQIGGNQEIDLRSAATGGVLGAFSGGSLAATAQVAPLARNVAGSGLDSLGKRILETDTMQNADRTRNATEENHLDKKHKWYDPATPIDTVTASVKRGDTTATVQANQEKVDAFHKTAKDNLDIATQNLEVQEQAISNKAILEDRLTKIDAALLKEGSKPIGEQDAARIAELRKGQTSTFANLERVDNAIAKYDDVETLKKEKERMTTAFNNANVAYVEASKKLAATRKKAEAKSGTYTNDGQNPTATAAKTKSLFSRVFRSPRDADSTDIEAAISESTNPKEAEILRTLSDVRIKENALKSSDMVSQDILKGNRAQNYVGLDDYDSLIDTAITREDVGKYNTTMAMLDTFSASHNSKAEAVEKAAANVGINKFTNVARIAGTQEWEVTDRKLSKLEREKYGALQIHKNSGKLIDSIKAEAALLVTKQNVLREVGNYHFNPENIAARKKAAEATGPNKYGSKTGSSTTKTAPVKVTAPKVKATTTPPKSKVKAKPVSIAEDLRENYKESVPYRETEASDTNAGNFTGVGKNRKQLTSIAPEQAKTLETLAAKSNKFIGFGNSTHIQAFRTGFSGAANISVNYPDNAEAKYKADDNVLVYALVSANGVNEKAINEAGIKGTTTVSKARRLEIDNAADAGATITLLSELSRTSIQTAPVRQIAEYLTQEKGYVEGQVETNIKGVKRVTGNGIFTPQGNANVEPTVNTNVQPSQAGLVNTSETGKGKTERVGAATSNVPSQTQEKPQVTPVTQAEEVAIDVGLTALRGQRSLGAKNSTGVIKNGLLQSQWRHVEEAIVPSDISLDDKARYEVRGVKNSVIFNQGNSVLSKNPNLFTSAIRSKDITKLQELMDGEKVTEENIKQLDSFIRLHELFRVALDNAYMENNSNSKETFLAEMLVNKQTGTFDENVVTAFTVAAFQYIQASGHSTFMTPTEVKYLLGMDSKARLPRAMYSRFKEVGNNRAQIFQELGQSVSGGLSIKPTDLATVTEKNQLDVSIGQMIYHVLKESSEDALFTESSMSIKEKLLLLIEAGTSAFDVSKALKVYLPGLDTTGLTTDDLINIINSSSTLNKVIYFARPNIKNDIVNDGEMVTTYQRNVLDIIESSVRTDKSVDIIGTIFGHGNVPVAPLAEAPTVLEQETIKGTDLGIPENQRSMLLSAAQNPWSIQTERADVILDLYDNSKDTLYSLLGIGSAVDVEGMHPILAENQLAEWEITRKGIDQKVAWLKSIKNEKGEYDNFYMKPVVWVNQRVGYESTLFNAQTSLFDRMLTGMEAWKTTVKTDEALFTADGKTTKHGRFLRALAENMEGVSDLLDINGSGGSYGPAARTVDKVASPDFLRTFQDYVDNNTELNIAVAAMQKLMTGATLTSGEQASIKATVKLFKMDEPGLGALMELARYKQAKDAGTVHKTMVGTQSDGVTNGPITTQILFGVAGFNMMGMGGIISNEDTSYFDQKRRGEQDLYEYTGLAQKSALFQYIEDGSTMSPLINMFDTIDNTYGTRKGAKTLVTPFNYGAGLPRVKLSIAEAFVDKVKDTYYGLYSLSGVEQEQQLADLNNKLRFMTDYFNHVFVNVDIVETSTDKVEANYEGEVEKLVLVYNHRKNKMIALNNLDGTKVGTNVLVAKLLKGMNKDSIHAVNKALRFDYKPLTFKFIELNELEKDFPARFNNIITELVGLTWGTASVKAIQDTSLEYILQRDEVTAATNTAFNIYDTLKDTFLQEVGKAEVDLTIGEKAEMDKALMAYRPALVSALGNENTVDGKRTGGVKYGLMLSKDKKVSLLSDRVKSRYHNLDASSNTKDKQYSAGFQYTTEIEPGVRGMALQIQAVDSFVSVFTVSQYPTINLHDANMGSLDNFEDMAVAQNKAHFNAMINYDAYVEVLQALMRPINGVQANLDKAIRNNGDVSLVASVLNRGYGLDESLTLQEYIESVVNSAYGSDLTKLNRMKEVKVHHQYAGENGQYEVTDADRAAIVARMEKLEASLKSDTVRIARQLKKMIADLTLYQANMENTEDSSTYVEVNNLMAGNSNIAFKDAINKADTLSIEDVMAYIKNSAKSPAATDIFNLFDSLNDTSVKGVRVRVVNNAKKAVSYDRLRDVIVIHRGNPDVSLESVARTALIAAMHKNTVAYKKGSNKHPHVNEQLRALGLLSNSANSYFDRAVKEKAISSADRKYLADTLGAHKGDIEYLMDFVMNDSKGAAILENVPFYEDTTTTPVSFFQRVIGFINNIISDKIGATTNIHKVLLSNINETLGSILAVRRSNTIKEVIAQSYTTHRNEFHREFNLSELNYWDGRINHELYKAKIANKGEPLKALAVLDIIENGLTNGLGTDNVNDAIYTEALLPVIKMLKETLGTNSKVVLIDSIDDLDGVNISEETKSELSTSGDAFYVDGVSYLFTPASSINPNTKVSTLIHELVHAVTKEHTSNLGNSKSVTNLSKLYEQLKDGMVNGDNHPDVVYAASKLDEFIAVASTSKAMKDYLAANSSNAEFYAAWAKDLGIKNKADVNGLTVFSNLMSEFHKEHKVRDYADVQQKAFTDITKGLKVPLSEAALKGTEVVNSTMFNTAEVIQQGQAALRNMAYGVENQAFIDTYNKAVDINDSVENIGELTDIILADNLVAQRMFNTVTSEGSLLTGYLNSFGSNKVAASKILSAVVESEILRSPRNNSNTTSRGFRFTPQDLFSFLGSTDPADNQAHLQQVVTDVVTPLMDSIDGSLLEGYELYKVWQDALLKGDAVFISEAYNAGFELNDQQGFVLETTEVALNAVLNDVTDTKAYTDIRKLYKEAKRVLLPSDFHRGNWNQATFDEVQLAETKYNFIFNTPVSATGESDYLTRFIALGLVDPQLRDAMSRTVVKDERTLGFGDSLIALMKDIVMWIYNLKNLLPGSVNVRDRTNKYDTLKTKLDKLSFSLVEVYNKHNDMAAEKEANALDKTSDFLEGITDTAILAGTGAVRAIANLPYLQRGIVGKVSQLVAADAHEHLPGFIDATFNNNNETLSEGTQIINEIIGTDSSNIVRKVKDFLNRTKFIEQTRQQIAENTANAIMDYFHEDNKNMSKEERASITKVLLRTDLQSLMGNTFSFEEVMGMVRSPNKLNTEIRKLEGLLSKEEHGNEYLIRSKMLAEYMVFRTGDNHNMLAKNAYAIGYRYGLSERPQDVSQAVLKQIDSITSLYALKATKAEDKQRVLDIHTKETGTINGLEFTMKTQQTIAKKTDELFKYNPWAKNKGYLPNITNPNKGFVVISPNEVEAYIKQGYVKGAAIQHSELDLTGEKVLMILPHSGKQRYVSGALSIEDSAKSGTTILTRNQADFKAVALKVQRDFERMVATTPYNKYSRDMEVKGLVPSFSDNGEIISFSYEMNATGLDTYLQRNNDFAHLLGHYAGGTHGRQHNPQANKTTLDYIMDVYEESPANSKGKFVEVSANAKNPKARAYWHSLPREMQLYITEQTGEPVIQVRNDMLNILFGFSKYTPSAAFDKSLQDRNIVEKMYTTVLRAMFGEKALLRSNQFIGGWQELIGMLKDFEVVRSIDVFMGNIVSNIAFALVNDFSPLAMINDIGLATESSIAYYADMTRMNDIELALSNGYSTAALLSEYAELKDSIARNPLLDFIEAGMMPTIVNDVSFAKDDYSYKSSLSTKLDNTISKIPTPLRNTGKLLVVSQDTGLYKFLATATQQSDFVFKYAVYKQELKAGKSKEEAMRFAREMFIEYDVPTSKGMQFVNDMGSFMYTKFAFRIQRVIAHLLKKRGAKLLGESIITPMIFALPSIMSLHILSRIFNGTNPLRMPLDDVLTMVDEAAPLALLLDILGLGGDKFNI